MNMRNELHLADLPMPNTATIERQVLSDIVHSPELIPEVQGLVRKDFFTNPARARIWDSIMALFNQGEGIDLPSVYSRAGKDFLDEVISHTLESSTPTVVYSHARLLRDAAVRRCGYISAVRFVQSCTDGEKGEEDVLAGIQQIKQDVEGLFPAVTETRLEKVINGIADDIQERAALKQKGLSDRISTGFPSLDWLTYQGWGPGQLVILAARPSVGKTAIMLQMAKAAARCCAPTMVFSLEMTEAELGQRMLYSTGFVKPKEVMSGKVDWSSFENAAGELSPLPVFINDTSRNLQEIVSKITIAHQRGMCGIAFIDYLGLIQTGTNLPLTQAISLITGELKATAKRLKIPIVLLCQLNRLMARENRPPELYDLRDSGSIEQDADIVLMLEPMPGIGEIPDLKIWLRKNRQYQKDISLLVRPNDSYTNFVEINKSIQK